MSVQAIVEAIVSFVREHESWAMPIAFLVAFGESFCFLSLIWPGTAILAGIAILLAASGVDMAVMWPAIGAAAAGGALGYTISFWIGHTFKESVPRIWPFSTHPKLIPTGERFFEKYGLWGVFLGHFFGPVRAVIPVVAGMFAMRQLPFQVANIASAFIWAAGIIAPAFYLVTFKQEIFAFLLAHEAAVALTLFALALLNSIPHPLLFLPTILLFVAVGGLHLLAGGDVLTLWLAGAGGAFLGNLISYHLGQRRKDELVRAWLMSSDAETIADLRAQVQGLGLQRMVLSMFLGRKRAVVPFVAGASAMPRIEFALASVVAALVWSGVLLSPRPIAALFGY